ncbi:hypothetical protein T4A_6261 [Trichinella pseudospiralis]|uniref:Uncharacterized protein n=1 Tax=Trichinella pseudospiralis TaxID=6337 RepID=A0A0V1E7V1_TRIPS|nr:hypothetical protein T4A_6261 [Trichinella pseudospiralis]
MRSRLPSVVIRFRRQSGSSGMRKQRRMKRWLLTCQNICGSWENKLSSWKNRGQTEQPSPLSQKPNVEVALSGEGTTVRLFSMLPLQAGSTETKNRPEPQKYQSWDDQRLKKARGRHHGLVVVSIVINMDTINGIVRIGSVTRPRLASRHDISFDGNRYSVGLLWKRGMASLPNNYATAIRRYRSLEKLLSRDPVLDQDYTTVVQSYLDNGWAEEAPASRTPGKTWYLRHHAVY